MDKTDLQKKIVTQFGNKLRVRVCGLCIEDDKILLINHHSLNKSGDFWGPPGGGMDFGFSAEENLAREFREETGLIVEIEQFLFVHEYLKPPLHAIELIFLVKKIGGKLSIGFDPEMDSQSQIIHDLQYLSMTEIKTFDKHEVHQLFHFADDLASLTGMRGYYRWEDESK